jgi:hypothetical protein
VKCLHCKDRKANRPRGLCWACYYDPAIRDLYQPVSKYGRRGTGNVNRNGGIPQPTTAITGTPEHLEVLAGRAARGEQLHHPKDSGRE